MKKKLGYIGIGSNGNHYTILKNPRKELMEQLEVKSAQKMYVDTTDGKTKHKGYVVAGVWIDIYEVHEWKVAEGGDEVNLEASSPTEDEAIESLSKIELQGGDEK